MGDFVRGSIHDLRKSYPEGVVQGVAMHRDVDRFTDSHPCFKEAKGLLGKGHRRFAGVIVDIFFDHYLAVHWNEYYGGTLSGFIEKSYSSLESHPEWLSPRLKEVLPLMRQQDWLRSYGTMEGIRVTLQRVSKRGVYTAPIEHGFRDFVNHYQSFDRVFHEFFPQLQRYAADWKLE